VLNTLPKLNIFDGRNIEKIKRNMNKNKNENYIKYPLSTKATIARKDYNDSIMKNDIIRHLASFDIRLNGVLKTRSPGKIIVKPQNPIRSENNRNPNPYHPSRLKFSNQINYPDSNQKYHRYRNILVDQDTDTDRNIRGMDIDNDRCMDNNDLDTDTNNPSRDKDKFNPDINYNPNISKNGFSIRVSEDRSEGDGSDTWEGYYNVLDYSTEKKLKKEKNEKFKNLKKKNIVDPKKLQLKNENGNRSNITKLNNQESIVDLDYEYSNSNLNSKIKKSILLNDLDRGDVYTRSFESYMHRIIVPDPPLFQETVKRLREGIYIYVYIYILYIYILYIYIYVCICI
jgi:hypothetical protein